MTTSSSEPPPPEFTPFGEGGARPAFRPLGAPPPPETLPPESPPPESPAPESPLSDNTRGAFQAGYELGREETRSQLESIAESLGKSLEEVADFRARLRERYERELLEVALGVARKVVQRELAERPEIWLGMIRGAVRRAVDRERIVVRAPARLHAFLRTAVPELRAALEDVRDLELVEDPALPEGGCVIESRFGEIDIGVETQLARAERALVAAEE